MAAVLARVPESAPWHTMQKPAARQARSAVGGWQYHRAAHPAPSHPYAAGHPSSRARWRPRKTATIAGAAMSVMYMSCWNREPVTQGLVA